MSDDDQRSGEPAGAPDALHAIVHGRVQGVGFRAFVRRNAVALGLDGWVRNLADGRSVELYAAGERAGLQCLVQRLREGPRFAAVDDVSITWQARQPGDTQRGFQIRY